MQTNSNETYEQRREREQRERAERHVATLAAARAAAAIFSDARLTGGTWTLEPNTGVDGDECRAVLRCGAHKHRIAIDGDQYGHTGKFHVHGWYNFGPSELSLGMPHGVSSPSIDVSQSRGGAVLGKEIQRRFLPDFNKVCERLDARTREASEFRGARTGILERLASVVSGKEKVNLDAASGNLYLYGREGERTIDVHASRNSVDLKIPDVSEETAAAIIRLVRGLL
jgi:hypothetical protein